MNRLEKIGLSIKQNSYSGYCFLAVLFIFNIAWFSNLGPHTLMGDDLVNWKYYHETPHFFDAVITNHEFGKYRPIFNLFEFSLFKLFTIDTQLLFWFNILFNFANITLFFYLIKKISKNNIIALLFSLLYLTSRFSYYNILQITGFIEALSIFWLISVLYLVASYLVDKKISLLYWSLFFNLLIIFTHERYIVLLPFILTILYIATDHYREKRHNKVLIILAIMPVLLNLFVKKYLFQMSIFVGTAGTNISINIATVLSFFRDGVLNIFGLNIGPEYLSAVKFNDLDAIYKAVSYLIFSVAVIVIIASIYRWKRKSDDSVFIKQITYLGIFSLLTGSLLLAASITIRQEFRWLYAPYVVFIVYLAYLFSKDFTGSRLRYALLLVFIASNLYTNTVYRNYIDNIFFIYSQKIADSFAKESIGLFGCNDTTFIVEEFSDSNWIMPASLFFQPYGDCEIRYVKSFDEVNMNGIDRSKTHLYKLNWQQKKMNIINDDTL
jgi:hypothetical protein